MLLALCVCAIGFFAIVIVVRAEGRREPTPVESPTDPPLPLPPGLYVGPGYSITDSLHGMPEVAVIERRSDGDALAIGRLDGDRVAIAKCSKDAVRRIAWTCDGGSILWTRKGLERVRVEGAIVERLLGDDDDPIEVGTVVVEPRGPRVFFTMRRPKHARFTAHVLHLDHGKTTALGADMRDGDVQGADVVWSKDIAVVLVRRLRFRESQFWELGLDGEGGREIGSGSVPAFTVDPTGSIVVLTHDGDGPMLERGRWYRWSNRLTSPAWSTNGELVAGTANDVAMWVYDMPAARGEKLLEVMPPIPPEEVRTPVWSQDGRFLAFWLGSSEKSDHGIRLFVADVVRREIWIAGGSIGALAWRPT